MPDPASTPASTPVSTPVSTPAVAPAVTPLTAAELDALVRTHLPLVGHLVRETLSRVPSFVARDDLVSAGMYALAAAAKAFDPAQGVAFGAYATIRVRGALADELRSRDWASRSVRGRARELEQVRTDLAATLHRTPTRAEIAQAMGVTVADVDAVDADVHRAGVVSLQAVTPEGGELPLPATTGRPDELLEQRERVGVLHDAVAELPERLQVVVRGWFVDQRTLADIAADLGVTESRVSQLRTEALGLLREAMTAHDRADTATTPVPMADLTARSRGRLAARAAYVAAVASRSTLTQRLAATTPTAEPHTALGVPIAT